MCRAFDYAEMACQHIYVHRISNFSQGIAKQEPVRLMMVIGQEMVIVERKGLLKNGDEETRQPYIDE